MTELVRYDGKRVVVTGGASGQGAALATLVGDLGATVVVCDIQKPDASGIDYVHVDLGDPDSIRAAAEDIGGPVDGLFNCAGLPMTKPPMDVFRVNFLGLREFTELVLPKMSEDSAIVSISSIAGMGWMQHLAELLELLGIGGYREGEAWIEAHPDLLGDGYSLAKEAIVVYTMARGAALMTQKRIRVNAICPGAVETPMLPEFVKAAGQQAIDMVGSAAGRASTPDEQAKVLAFLNSDAASYINGTHVFTDGGFTAAIYTGITAMPAKQPNAG